MVNRPIVNPFTETVSIKNTIQESDRFFRRIPVLKGIWGFDAMFARICLGGSWS